MNQRVGFDSFMTYNWLTWSPNEQPGVYACSRFTHASMVFRHSLGFGWYGKRVGWDTRFPSETIGSPIPVR